MWIEDPGDGGSAVWGCYACLAGNWNPDTEGARLEAELHDDSHGADAQPLRPARVDAKRDALALQLDSEGRTLVDIAKLAGFHNASSASRALARLGRPRRVALTATREEKERHALHLDDGRIPYALLAELSGLTARQVTLTLQAQGRQRRQGGKHTRSPERDARVRSLADQGYAKTAIARELGVSVSQVKYSLKHAA